MFRYLVLCSFVTCLNGYAQKFTNIVPFLRYDTDTSNKLKNKEIGLIPVVYRTPETGFATGIVFSALFKMPGVTDTNVRTSNFVFPALITERKQFNIGFQYNLITNKERWFFRGMNLIQKFNEYFYGAGNKAIQSKDGELISYNFLRLTQRASYRFYSQNFVGLQYNLYDTWQLKGDSLLAQGDVIGNKGYLSSGFGLVYLLDTRDNIVYASKGTYLDVSTYSYLKGFGSAYTFHNLLIDYRQFYTPFKNHTIAFNTILNLNTGDVPFMQLAHLGGQYMMRGYYYGRFRDRIYTAMQVEYRLKIWRFLGATVFGALGNVAHDFQQYDFNTFRYAYGAGLRIAISKRENVNLRLDAGFGENTSGFYLTVGEAF